MQSSGIGAAVDWSRIRVGSFRTDADFFAIAEDTQAFAQAALAAPIAIRIPARVAVRGVKKIAAGLTVNAIEFVHVVTLDSGAKSHHPIAN
jgi:hypothetical protein